MFELCVKCEVKEAELEKERIKAVQCIEKEKVHLQVSCLTFYSLQLSSEDLKSFMQVELESCRVNKKKS